MSSYGAHVKVMVWIVRVALWVDEYIEIWLEYMQSSAWSIDYCAWNAWRATRSESDTTSRNLLRCMIDQTQPGTLSQFWHATASARHRLRCFSPLPRHPPGPSRPMKTDCGRVYALRCTALPDAEAGPDFHLSACRPLPELVRRPPDRESRIWRRRPATESKTRWPPSPLAATCAENWIGSIWRKAHLTRQIQSRVVLYASEAAVNIDHQVATNITWFCHKRTPCETIQHNEKLSS